MRLTFHRGIRRLVLPMLGFTAFLLVGGALPQRPFVVFLALGGGVIAAAIAFVVLTVRREQRFNATAHEHFYARQAGAATAQAAGTFNGDEAPGRMGANR